MGAAVAGGVAKSPDGYAWVETISYMRHNLRTSVSAMGQSTTGRCELGQVGAIGLADVRTMARTHAWASRPRAASRLDAVNV